MQLTLLAFTMATTISILVFLVSWSLAHRSTQDREKMSPFECGFEPTSSARLPFSLRFFLLAVIFLVFDIEIVLLFPAPSLTPLSSPTSAILGVFFFLTILLLGLLHEWNEGSLNWTK